MPPAACAKAKCAQCCRSFCVFLFSTIGLVLLLAAYSTLGGSLFLWLEKDSEVAAVVSARLAMASERRAHAEALWSVTERLNILYKDNWTHEAERVLREFEKRTYQLTTTTKWDGQSPEDPLSPKWTFAGSLFYAITAITTIGYGHVTPVTKEGQICTMVYALIGIPLTVMCMYNVGKFFASLSRLTYHALCCGLCCLCCVKRRRRAVAPLVDNKGAADARASAKKTAKAAPVRDSERGEGGDVECGLPELKVTSHLAATAPNCAPVKKATPDVADVAPPGPTPPPTPPPQSTPMTTTTPTTTPPPPSPRRSEDCNGGVGPLPPRECLSPATNAGFGDGRDSVRRSASKEAASGPERAGSGRRQQTRRRADPLGRLALCRRKIRKALKEQAPVPSYLCLVIMSVYITGGALIFSLWEDWDYVSGAYFCFVTLTTIGFGDLVPGVIVGLSDAGDWNSASKLLLCALYLFVGLALIAMCFDLMREDVTLKAVRIGRRIGLLKRPPEEKNDKEEEEEEQEEEDDDND